MKIFLFLLMALCAMSMANAQEVVNNYDNVGTIDDYDEDEKESFVSLGLGYFSYDGFENYGICAHTYTYNGFGMGLNFRAQFKEHGNFNSDLLFNYSLGVYQQNKIKVLLTGELGPSLRTQDQIDGYENGKVTYKRDKFFIDGFVGAKATLKYDRFVGSVGYHLWALKFKFSEGYKADGFYAQIAYCF